MTHKTIEIPRDVELTVLVVEKSSGFVWVAWHDKAGKFHKARVHSSTIEHARPTA